MKGGKLLKRNIIIAVGIMALLTACNTNDTNSSSSPDTSSNSITSTDTSSPEVTTAKASETQAVTSAVPETFTVTAPGAGFTFEDAAEPQYSNVSVHDPSIIKTNGTYYVYGSHMASAKTDNFLQWTQISTSAQKGNKLIPDPAAEMAEAFEWAQTKTFWAGDVQEMPNGKYYMYYCNCEGSKPLGCIGLAIADNPEGPFTDSGIFLKSGMAGISPSGTNYNATIHPNAVDPHSFFDNDGQFWMVYGSYSGGIYILKMDPETGLPTDGQGYGKKLLGANHSRIEGPYILYSPETEYYYLFLSFGGLDSTGGYNMRVCRSKNPDGPYEDALGHDMINCHGANGTFFDDKAVEPYGVKIMGNYQFKHEDGESGRTTAYKSPGHNSAYYDEQTGKYYLIFHTRFGSGEGHEVRVHEMFLNEDGWFTVAPIRYDAGEIRTFTAQQLSGSYKVINHEKDITDKVKVSQTVNFNNNGTISGPQTGTWTLGEDGKTAHITLDDILYKGVFLRQYDKDNSMWVMTFTALSEDGTALWGCGAALS